MRRWLMLVFAWSACASVASAQISVRLQTEKDFFLLYEAIPVVVSLHNMAGRTIQLEGATDQPWLTFRVTDEHGTAVQAAGRLSANEPVLVPAGKTVSRTVDLLPLYELRSHGNYRVQARVNAGGIQTESEVLKFSIFQGRELWKKVVGLPSIENEKDEYRQYTLLAHRGERDEMLYLSIKDNPPRLVYGVISLGVFLSATPTDAQIDREGNVHVLFQNGPRSFGYVEVDPRAKLLQRAAFSDRMSKPRLLTEAGNITVRGGEQIYPKQERILTEEDLNPPPPPEPPKKKKWWWPFGKKEEKPFFDELPPTPPQR